MRKVPKACNSLRAPEFKYRGLDSNAPPSSSRELGIDRHEPALNTFEAALGFIVVGIVEQNALVGGERPARLAVRFGELGIAQVEFGICRIFQNLRVELRQIVGCGSRRPWVEPQGAETDRAKYRAKEATHYRPFFAWQTITHLVTEILTAEYFGLQ